MDDLMIGNNRETALHVSGEENNVLLLGDISIFYKFFLFK